MKDFLCQIEILVLKMLKLLKIPGFLIKIPGFFQNFSSSRFFQVVFAKIVEFQVFQGFSR